LRGIENVSSAESAIRRTESNRPRPLVGWTIVASLTFAYAVSFLDRTVLVLLLDPIKADLGLSDAQLGLLHGFGFVMFYVLLGVPIGRWVDRSRRGRIVALGALVWTAMTACCGLARNYTTLFAARLGVGAGEATLGPAAFSLIGDAVAPEQQPRALTVYSTGIYIGQGLALVAGGWLLARMERTGGISMPVFGQLEVWQSVFMIAAVPGLLVAFAMWLLPEPERNGVRRKEQGPAGRTRSVPLDEIAAWIWGNRLVYAGLIVGFSLIILVGFGVGTWVPTMFMRTHGLTPQAVGTAFGMITIVFGMAGALTAGQLSSLLMSRGYGDAPLRIAIAALAGIVLFSLFPLAGSPETGFVLLAGFTFLSGFPFGLGSSALNLITPNQMRGQMSALFHLAINLIGVGIGPLAIGLLTDTVFDSRDGVRYSIVAVCWTGLPLAILLLLAARNRFAECYAKRQAWEAA